MPDKDASTPRVFLIRHGETEWSQSGRYTGSTEIPLTSHGQEQVRATRKITYGAGKLIDPAKIAKVWVSPRDRAVKTYQLLSGQEDGYETTESLEEWNYGYVGSSLLGAGCLLTRVREYEGLLPKEIKEKRASQGLDQDRKWNMWRDGCVGGE